MTVNINNDIPEPFREFSGSEKPEVKNPEMQEPEQEISATSLGTENKAERSRTDMQDLLFLAAILMLCDD